MLEVAHRNSEIYDSASCGLSHSFGSILAIKCDSIKPESCTEVVKESEDSYVATKSKFCTFCSTKGFHPRFKCPAKCSKCFKCGFFGHFAKMCRSRNPVEKSSTAIEEKNFLSALTLNEVASKVNYSLKVNGGTANALIDTGST